jgi:hypothetical protein
MEALDDPTAGSQWREILAEAIFDIERAITKLHKLFEFFVDE